MSREGAHYIAELSGRLKTIQEKEVKSLEEIAEENEIIKEVEPIVSH